MRPLLASLICLSGCAREASAPQFTPFLVDTFATADRIPFERPVEGVTLPDGRVAISDMAANRVFLLTPGGELDTVLGRPGAGPGELTSPRSLQFRQDTLTILNTGNSRSERFRFGQGFLPSRPLPADVQYKFAALLPGDSVLMTTGGTDSALVILQDATGHTVARYGTLAGAASSEWDFDAMRTDILAGRIPLPFRNQALPIAAPNGDVWLVCHADGRLLRFSRAGTLLVDVGLPEADIAPIREAFFAANRAEKRPGVLRGYYLSFSGVATQHSLWLLLAPPDSLPPTLLQVDSLGAIAERHVLHGAEGARRLILNASGDGFFLTNPTEGVVFRLRRASPGTAAE